MNVTSKLDLDGLLKDWPAPATRDDAAWEARADQVVEAARARRSEGAAALAALLDTPALAPEPGEPNSPAVQAVGDGISMSQESDEDRASKPEAGPAAAARAADRKRPSLKEIAERASQSGRASAVPGALATPIPSGRGSMPPGRGSMPPARASTPPGRGSMPPGRGSMPPGRGSMPSGLGSTPPGRPVEAGKDDSGVVDLHLVQSAATAEQKAAAEKAKPATADLFEDDKPVAVAALSARQPRTGAAAASAPAKKGTNGVVVGGAIALFGLAAAFAIMRTAKEPPAQTAMAPTPAAAPAPAVEKTEAKPAEVAAAPPAAEKAAPEDKGAEAPKPATAAGAGAAAAPVGAPPAAAGGAKAEPGKVAAAPAASAAPGDLSSAMQAAVGSDGSKASAVTEAPEPAAGKKDQSIPEQPPQGSVAAAIGSVMPAAKACVSGADDVSRAQITFSSTGSVSNVSVTGWAASNGQTACVKAALKAANVGAFSKASYTAGVTIRP